MNRPTHSVLRWPLVLLIALLGATDCAGRAALASAPDATEANITRITSNILEQSQFSHHALDRELANKFLDSYLDALDGTRSVFLQTDLAEFAAYRATLAQTTRSTGDTAASRKIFKRYLERLGQRAAFVAETLKAPKFEFAGHENYSLDREKAARPADMAAAQGLWRTQLRAEYLQEKLAGTAPAEIGPKLTRRYAQQLDTMKALSEGEVLEVYLSSLAHVYDPHSDYLGHEQMESFSISMNLSLFGIGASLASEDGYCTIREVLRGGPAARSGALKPGDRIIAVAQDHKDPVDVVNMPLSRTVGLIRGPKGSIVTLTVIGASTSSDGAPARAVRLVRDKIQLEDQAAKARIIDLPRPDGSSMRIGVLDVPEFYADMSERKGSENRSVTVDVARLLNKLKSEKVQGIVLDLRQNGGGSLKEAISLTGLFIKQGPVVQTKEATGDVDVASDPDPSVLYDGPLVLLTSRFSASASEILAGALQDYGRAVIVGDSQTFGKGTVQSILPLARIMDQNGLAHAYDPGALKITISKFYRPAGSSTQLRGVASDIVLPSTSDFSEVSESALKNPLPWSSVPAARYEPTNRVKPYVNALREKSSQRVAADKDFGALKEDIARLKKNIDTKSVTLNETERKEELAENKARGAARKEALTRLRNARPKTFEVTLANVDSAGLQVAAPDAGVDAGTKAAANDETNDGPAAGEFAQELIANEGVRILADYVDLTKPKPKQ